MFRLFLYVLFLLLVCMYSVKVYIITEDRLKAYGSVGQRPLSAPLQK